MKGIGDLELMRRIRAGDERAFGTFLSRHRELALAVAGRYGAESEDVLQEASLSAWRARRSFDPDRGQPLAWFLRIVKNRAVDRRRADARRERLAAGPEPLEHQFDRSPGPAETAVIGETISTTRRAVASLPASQRRVIALGYFGGLSQGEVAARVRAPLGTVKGRKRLALGKLRAAMAPLVEG